MEPLPQAGKYVRGLLSDLPRKNCWTLAEYAGDATPDRMRRLLERASWDMMAAMGTVRGFVTEHLAGDDGRRCWYSTRVVMRRPAPPRAASSGSTSAVSGIEADRCAGQTCSPVSTRPYPQSLRLPRVGRPSINPSRHPCRPAI
jgi:hypothetical protein